MMDHPSSINRFDAFGDYDYVDTSHHVTHNTPNFESLKGVKSRKNCYIELKKKM